MKLSLKCNVDYIKLFLSQTESNDLYNYLLGFKALKEMLVIETISGEKFTNSFGKMMFIDSKLYEENKFHESVWGPTATWPKEMLFVKNRVENLKGFEFQTCVCIYYPDGNSGVGYHSDYIAFGDTTVIPSISLGEERVFKLREKVNLKEHEILLENGSLIIMGENCQERYEHSLPLNHKYKEGRINLTFRKYGFDKNL